MLSRPPPSLARRTSSSRGVDGFVEAAEGGDHPVLIHLVEESVAADQVAVADDGLHLPGVDGHGPVDAQGPGEDVALRVALGLLGRDAALPDQAGHQAVVLGELLDALAPEAVEPRVADVDDGEAFALGGVHVGQGGERGAHPLQVGVGARLLEDRLVGRAHGPDEGRRGRFVVGLAEDGEGGGRSDLTALVAAHPVGDGEELALPDEVAVLVVGPHPAHVGGRAGPELRHASSITVLPTCRRSPRFMTMAPVTRARLR